MASSKAVEWWDAWMWLSTPTIALHQRHFQSCRRRTLPQVLSQTAHLALTGRFPSNHWWGIAICGEGGLRVKDPKEKLKAFVSQIQVDLNYFSELYPFIKEAGKLVSQDKGHWCSEGNCNEWTTLVFHMPGRKHDTWRRETCLTHGSNKP